MLGDVLGTTIPGFFVITLLVMGFATVMTGLALANTWRPAWQVVLYCGLLGFADRFLVFALFDGDLLSLSGFLIDSLFLVVLGLISFRIALVRQMAAQYPWLYERSGLFGWRERN